MLRRSFMSRLAALPFFGFFGQGPETTHKPLKIMMKSAWGSDDPTRASFAFLHGLALAEAGHEVQIFLTGEATYLMRQATADAIMAVGWPSLKETHEKIVAKHIKVFS
jgi:predicted peroxiredoxin